jgi:hypothetical protein
LPFLSISRDKRGYETTALLHAPAGHKGQPKPRLLYWFRTPPDVRVGVEPFSDEIRRAIESRHRDLTFDWDRILAAPGSAAPATPPRDLPGTPPRSGAARSADAGERKRSKRRRPRRPADGTDGGVPNEGGTDPDRDSSV